MQFGKSTTLEGFTADDFALPPDHPQTGRILRGSDPSGAVPVVRCGGTVWTVPAWKGTLYPARGPQREWPHHYGTHFGTLELNATHYRIYPPEKMAAWAAAMPDGFRFCPKFPQIITHFRRFRQCEGPTDDFIQGLLALGDRLGPSFIQLPPQFAPSHASALLSYLAQWPRELPLAIEFRHPEWFTGHPDAEVVWEAMEAYGVGSVLSDTALRRDAVHMRLTAPFLLLRYGGGDGHPTDASRIADWVQRWQHWGDAGLQAVYFLVHQPDSLRTPETCRLLADSWQQAVPQDSPVVAPKAFHLAPSPQHLAPGPQHLAPSPHHQTPGPQHQTQLPLDLFTESDRTA
jgi:uncharacterized protein YecE (DUF72 family)